MYFETMLIIWGLEAPQAFHAGGLCHLRMSRLMVRLLGGFPSILQPALRCVFMSGRPWAWQDALDDDPLMPCLRASRAWDGSGSRSMEVKAVSGHYSATYLRPRGLNVVPLGWYMGGCQNYGPLLGPLKTRCRIILSTQKGTILLTTTHIRNSKWGSPSISVLGPLGIGLVRLHNYPDHNP